jgi:hypothetical protein
MQHPLSQTIMADYDAEFASIAVVDMVNSR